MIDLKDILVRSWLSEEPEEAAEELDSLVTQAWRSRDKAFFQALLEAFEAEHHVMTPSLAVVYVSGAFIKDTLKCDATTTVDALEPRLRELGVYARPSVHYPSEYTLSSPLSPLGPPAAMGCEKGRYHTLKAPYRDVLL
jgi:hypothetical protein